MKKIIYLLLFSAIGAIVACSGKKGNQSGNLLILSEDTVVPSSVHQMQVSKAEQNIKYKGKNYHLSLVRTPNDLLPHVSSEAAGTYVDNQIILKIVSGAEQIFNKTFTKKDFASVVDPNFYDYSILEGMVYDKTTPEGMVFATSLSYPQTDLYMPVSVTVTADGKMSMKKEEPMDDVNTNE